MLQIIYNSYTNPCVSVEILIKTSTRAINNSLATTTNNASNRLFRLQQKNIEEVIKQENASWLVISNS
jgi:hypothetical protein